MNRQHLGVLFVSSTLALTVGCASKTPEPEPIEKQEVVEVQSEPAAAIPAPVVNHRAVDLPPLDSITVYFDYDSSKIKATELGLIDTHANYLMENSDQRLVLEGHTDERGSDEYNNELGERRAKAIYNSLIDQGIAPNQIRIVSFGESQPEVLGRDEDAWRSNRRVEFAYELSEQQQAALNFSAPQTVVLSE